MRQVVVTEGVFSKLTIELTDGMINKLALIENNVNPLAKVELKLKRALREFEKAYSKAVQS